MIKFKHLIARIGQTLRDVRLQRLYKSWKGRGILALIFITLAGISIFMLQFSETSFGGIPVGPDEIVVKYELGMAHSTFGDTNFTETMPPVALMYANGTMICGDVHKAGHSTSSPNFSPATHRIRHLSAAEKKTVFAHLLKLGFLAESEDAHTGRKYDYPTAVTDTVRLNSTTGALQASRVRGETNPRFTAMAEYLDSQCAAATTPYDNDDITVQADKLPYSPENAMLVEATLDDLPAIAKDAILSGAVANRDASTKARAHLRSADAKAFKARVKSDKIGYYKLDGAIYRIKVNTMLPRYTEPKTFFKRKRFTASAQSAKTPVRFLYVRPSDVADDGHELAYATDIAKHVQEYFLGNVGSSINISTISVVRSTQTSSQLVICPANEKCDERPNVYPVDAADRNLQDEFNDPNASTVMIAGFDMGTGSACTGMGGAAVEGADQINTHGFALTPDLAYCDGGRRVGSSQAYTYAAHETGHTFGLTHTLCSSGDLMTPGPSCYASDVWNQVLLDKNQAQLLADYSPFFDRGVPVPASWAPTAAQSAPVLLPTPKPPTGDADRNICGEVGGWAYAPDKPADSLPITIVLSNPDGSGSEIFDAGSTTVASPDINKIYSITGTHRFFFTVPEKWKNIPHLATVLTGNTQFYAGAATCNVQGAMNDIRCDFLRGWGIDWTNPASGGTVYAYLTSDTPNLPSGNSTPRQYTLSNPWVLRTDVNAQYFVTGNHGFQWTPPSEWKSRKYYLKVVLVGVNATSVLYEGRPCN